MKDNMRRALAGFTTFVVVCVASAFALTAVFAQLRFEGTQTFDAEFRDVTGLKQGDFVRIAGVEVGKVKKIWINSASLAVVKFSVDGAVTLTEGTQAAVRWADPIGNRYISLRQGAGGVKRLGHGDTIAVQHTQPALDLDTLLGGFRPLFRALDPEQVNALSSQLIRAFQGEGTTIESFLAQAGAVANTLADRDELIGQVITNLNIVLGSLGDQSDQLTKAVESLDELMKGLAARKSQIANAVSYTNASTAAIADLLVQARPPLKNTVAQSDRAASIVVADHEYVDDLLNTLPDSYKALSRLGIYGDFFTFYLCDAILKVNGKGGQPVYIKVAGQVSGRCAPK